MSDAALARIERDFAHVIESVDDSRSRGSDDGGVWIYLREGLEHEPGSHVIHEWTARACRSRLEDVRRGDCEHCTGDFDDVLRALDPVARELFINGSDAARAAISRDVLAQRSEAL